jgi:hypothetical protein
LLRIDEHLAIDSLSGYSLHSDEDYIEVSQRGNGIISAMVYSLDDDNLRWSRELDSVDIGRGFVMARALTGAGIGEPEGCGTDYSIQSISEYRNRFVVRYFHVVIRGVLICTDELPDTSSYAGYFVDISKDGNYRVVQIPHSLDFLNNPTKTELSRLLADNITIY